MINNSYKRRGVMSRDKIPQGGFAYTNPEIYRYVYYCQSGEASRGAPAPGSTVCPRCGLPYWSDYSPPAAYCTCGVRGHFGIGHKPDGLPVGWRCPGCSRVFAPDVKECGYCNG